MLSNEYLAGLIDGEGHIGFNINRYKKTEYLQPILCINMTFQPLIKQLHIELGGQYSIRKANYKENWKACYKWKVLCGQAIIILEKVFPYLIVKKDQADLAIRFYKYGATNNQIVNKVFKEAMHELNKRGTTEGGTNCLVEVIDQPRLVG
jgi:hypothetical protein